MRTVFFWDFKWLYMVVNYGRFGKKPIGYHSNGLWRWDPKYWPETSIRNCLSTLRKVSKERRSHSHRGGSLKSSNFSYLSRYIQNFSLYFKIPEFVRITTRLHAEPWLEKTYLAVKVTGIKITHNSSNSFAIIALRTCMERFTVIVTAFHM